MRGLVKAVFDEKYRFRKSRKEGLVNCVSCDNMTGGISNEEPAYCEYPERFRKIKIAEYWEGWSHGTSHNIASERVCDVYASKPLLREAIAPELHEKQVILLGTQSKDVAHADSNCPYVVEEIRKTMVPKADNKNNPFAYLTEPGVHIRDRSNLVPEETTGWQICEIPCCDEKLPYHTWRVDDYRRKVGIKPDGTEKKQWVRNGIIKHEKKVEMIIEEAEAVFDLERFNSDESGRIHNQIVAASGHLRANCNWLGSRPLSEAINPVCSSNRHSILKPSLIGLGDTGADFWIYDDRLFNIEEGLERPLNELERIPEGLIPCMDFGRILKEAYAEWRADWGTYSIYGILRELKPDDEILFSKGASHFIDVGAVNYHGHEHWWGVSGKGFRKMASFHEE